LIINFLFATCNGKRRNRLIIVIRVLLNLNFAQQVAALLDHLSIFAVRHAVVIVHLVVVDVIEIG
jgi:hypothetical protein